jgi:hypothetical protein
LGPETLGQPAGSTHASAEVYWGYEHGFRRAATARRKTSPASGCWRLASTKSSEREDDGKHSEAGTMVPLGTGFGPQRRSAGGQQESAGYLVNARPGGRRPRYFFGCVAGGGAGTSSPGPSKMSCFQRSKRESAILTRCAFSGPISCAAITLPSGLTTPSTLA